MNEDFSIVQLTPDDWELYRELRLEGLKNDPQAFGSNYEKELEAPEAKWRLRLAPYSEESQALNVFVKDNKTEKLAGIMGFYTPDTEVAQIVSVYISPKYRGKKLSSKLMCYLIDFIKSQGKYKNIKLSVNKEQLAAVNLYKSFGFEVVGEENLELGDHQIHTEALMELHI